MRINIYSQELITDMRGGEPITGSPRYPNVVEAVEQKSNTGVIYSAVRLLFHSSDHLHHPPMDDDRSAITFWLPKTKWRRDRFAASLRALADLVDAAKKETGLD